MEQVAAGDRAFRFTQHRQHPGQKPDHQQRLVSGRLTLRNLVCGERELLQVTEQATQYLQNDGVNGFTKKTLPVEAQYAPVYAITSIDANKDGKKDLLLAGNNSWTRIKFGRYSANHGVLLIGDGKGNFSYVSQAQSGLNIRGNVRSMLEIKTGDTETVFFGMNNAPVISYHLH